MNSLIYQKVCGPLFAHAGTHVMCKYCPKSAAMIILTNFDFDKKRLKFWWFRCI